MNKYFFGFLIFLIILLAVGEFLLEDVGYVLLNYQNYAIETSLWIFLIFILFLVIVWQLLSSSAEHFFGLSHWRVKRRNEHARAKTMQGLLALVQGQWDTAEKKLMEGSRDNEYSFVNLIGAAEAANALKKTNARNQYIETLLRQEKKPIETSARLIQAQLQLDNEEWDQAKAILEPLRKKHAKDPGILKSLILVYQKSGDWKNLLKHLQSAEKLDCFEASELESLQKAAYTALLKAESKMDVPDVKLLAHWTQLPQFLLQDTAFVELQIKHLISLKKTEAARQILERILRQYWQPKLAPLYAKLPHADVRQMIAFLDNCLKEHAQEAEIHLALGHLYLRLRDWNQAKASLETSIRIKPIQDAYLELAQMFSHHKQYELSTRCFEQARTIGSL